jgi:hypothetical protein
VLIFEQLVGRRFRCSTHAQGAYLQSRGGGKFPAIRKAKMAEFKWLAGEWTAENRVQATPTTPAYTDTYLYTYQLCEGDTRISITGLGGILGRT